MLFKTVRRLSTMISNERNFKAALIQMTVGTDRDKNLENAKKLIGEAARNGAKLVVLPECFNSPYGTKFFSQYAETIPEGQSSQVLSKAAKDNQVFLIGGSIPEKGINEKYYNTSTTWNPNGELVAKFRKMHLFDIDIPGGITFKESDILHGGNDLATFEMGKTKIGVGICYDLRFEELAKLYRMKGCEILVYPGAFNMTTGPMHWEILQRGRALDNQVYVMACSPARNQQGYIAFGHSQITNPWGKVIAQAGHEEEIIYGNIDLGECDKIRQQIPIWDQRRTDIYDTQHKQ
ncbi:omega-amidase NIT2 [Onthophagus taurus]|uniref:omega-amidase NIT2 n=1 Tax=Onthophagus taurus TaxID=166361 RepID=UPI000C1FEDE6|nr:omega-amidase NIT2 [Onthophagus taurus]